MSLRVYNTLSRQKEPFETVRPGKVGMYVCGPTVYKPSHVGHMVGPVIFDTVKRYLIYLGYEVTLVVNITDVDDKLIAQAQKQNTTVPELAERVTADYCRNLERLGVTGVDHLPRATQYIKEIIGIIQGLIDKGHAYPADGDVYFDVTHDPDYGKLCHRDPEQLEAGARIDVSDRKRNPGDFALWKGAKPGEPRWDSPWGPGRPGWHIECSAMAMRLLGQTLDIHGGGRDLEFPHHENELAQSESFTGVPFVRYWMHNGLMKVGSGKMSKSQGNEIVVSELLERHPPETLRFLLLTTHYRRPIDYTEERLEEVQRGLESFYRFFERFQRVTGSSFHDLPAAAKRSPFELGASPSEFLVEVSRHRSAFLECMDDDFNTGGAIGVLYELLRALNRHADGSKIEEISRQESDVRAFVRGAGVLRELAQILGIFSKTQPPPLPFVSSPQPSHQPQDLMYLNQGQMADASKLGPLGLEKMLEQLVDELGLPRPGGQTVAGLMEGLIGARSDARKHRNFELADKIRKRLGELGIVLEDRAGKTDWRPG